MRSRNTSHCHDGQDNRSYLEHVDGTLTYLRFQAEDSLLTILSLAMVYGGTQSYHRSLLCP